MKLPLFQVLTSLLFVSATMTAATTPANGEMLKKADEWLKANNYNRYGDPEGFMYMGGTPLFNESTGERIDRYDYLVKKFPALPWLKDGEETS